MADLLTGNILTLDPMINECRLTLETGVSVSTTDQTGKSTVYLTPHVGNRIAIYDGAASWKLYSVASDKSLSLGTLTSGKNYDIFAYDSSSNVTLELSAAWTNDTTRADALTTQDGILVKSGATTRRYLGTLRTTSTTTTEDSGGFTGTTQVGAKRFLYNYYNQVLRPMKVLDTADTWSYTTNTWRVANGATGPLNCVEYVAGDAKAFLEARLMWMATVVNNSARGAFAGVGLDSTSAAPVGYFAQIYNQAATAQMALGSTALYAGYPGLGYHYFSWMEKGADGTCSFHGDTGATDQCGLVALIRN